MSAALEHSFTPSADPLVGLDLYEEPAGRHNKRLDTSDLQNCVLREEWAPLTIEQNTLVNPETS
jgi:hypothetical protein